MHTEPIQLPRRAVGEWTLTSGTPYERPFADVAVDATFTSPSGKVARMPAFYDGDGTWRVRFNPGETGSWTFQTSSIPNDADLVRSGSFEVTPRETRGFLRSTPGRNWGFAYENGDAAFIFGDTVYNLFGKAHCGHDVASFLRRRKEQGFNLLRVRVPVSSFHPPAGYSEWQTRRTWPWGGSEQSPLFDEFNLDWFATVDEVVMQAETLGIGFEMIMEAWGGEFPFNSRLVFTPEWELLWMRYLIARYDAFTSVWFWTPMNEYEFYPHGVWKHSQEADRWQLRIARWIRATAPHGHPIAAHNGPRLPPFAERFRSDPEAVDTIMFQDWGTSDEALGWLAGGIEDVIEQALEGWTGSAVLAEWGYERNPDFDLNVPGHEFCDPDHTRRGAWRGIFSGLGIVHGFENTWGPWCALDEDQPGVTDLLHLHRFVLDVIGDAQVRPIHDEHRDDTHKPGFRPLTLATEDRNLLLTYLPAGGKVTVRDPQPTSNTSMQWFHPRTGAFSDATLVRKSDGTTATSPFVGNPDRPDDWILVCDNQTSG